MILTRHKNQMSHLYDALSRQSAEMFAMILKPNSQFFRLQIRFLLNYARSDRWLLILQLFKVEFCGGYGWDSTSNVSHQFVGSLVSNLANLEQCRLSLHIFVLVVPIHEQFKFCLPLLRLQIDIAKDRFWCIFQNFLSYFLFDLKSQIICTRITLSFVNLFCTILNLLGHIGNSILVFYHIFGRLYSIHLFFVCFL